MQNNRFRARRQLFALVFTATMTAMSIVLARLLVIPIGDIMRFELGFLPLAVVGNLFGPLYSGIGYLAADLLGQLVLPSGAAGINLMISFCKLLTGVLMGFAFYRKENTLVRDVCAFGIINVFVDFCAMSTVFVFWFSYTWTAAFTARAINAGITFPLRVISYYFIMKALEKPLSALRNKILQSRTNE